MGAPTSEFNHIIDALLYNLSTIKTVNGYATNVVFTEETAEPIRPEDVPSGACIFVTEAPESYEYLTAEYVDSVISYTALGWITIDPPGTPDTLKEALRSFVADFWRCFRSDLYLLAADSATGGSGQRLVKEHRIVEMDRQYSFPDAAFIASCRCKYQFNMSDT